MKILIWTAYGNTEVYALADLDKLQKVKAELVEVAEQYRLEKLNPDQSIVQIVQSINEQSWCVDAFEYLEISELK